MSSAKDADTHPEHAQNVLADTLYCGHQHCCIIRHTICNRAVSVVALLVAHNEKATFLQSDMHEVRSIGGRACYERPSKLKRLPVRACAVL